MINKWFLSDVEKVLDKHRYIVITDANGESSFLLDYLPSDVVRIDVGDEFSELEAKFRAETEFKDRKIAFYVKRKLETLSFLFEYAQTSGVLCLDSIESYVKNLLFTQLGKNTNISKDTLILAAQLGFDKDEKWWISVADGIASPFKMSDWILDFLANPAEVKSRMGDSALWNVFCKDFYSLINRPATKQPAETMAQEFANAMLAGLLDGSINKSLLDVYYRWSDSTEKVDVLKTYVNNYEISESVDPMVVHTDHPFARIDEKIFSLLSQKLRTGDNRDDVVKRIRQRVSSKKAKIFKPDWLESVMMVINFNAKGTTKAQSYDQVAKTYLESYAKLDTAMRKIYVAWLKDSEKLRPLQELYTNLNKSILESWYAVSKSYAPTQQGLVASALDGSERTAVIVCDGLRLEIAETVVNGLVDKSISVTRNTAFARLPSVTENGMSALFGCDGVVANAQKRFEKLGTLVPEVLIMQLGELNDSVTSRKLVLNYGDIDQVGEKKQLNGLKDIDNYEDELRSYVTQLFRMGYEKIVLTTDHGFVITGILDDADKEPRPAGVINKLEERFVLTNDPLKSDRLIEREDSFPNSQYQYYARTDKPFVTPGSYGYAHGGFTPQECVIPVYELKKKQSDLSLKVKIVNKESLKDITGNYFEVKVSGVGAESDLFEQSRRVKILTFAGSKKVDSSVKTFTPGMQEKIEFEWVDGMTKIVIVDADSAAQIDSCDLKKSSARDLGGLF